MKAGDKIHLNGCPDKKGVIVERIGCDRILGGMRFKVEWDNGKIRNNNIQTLCQCKDGKC